MMFCLSSKLFYLKYCLFFEFYGKFQKMGFRKIFVLTSLLFYIISTYTSYNKLRDSTSERERNFLFTSGCFNKHNSAVAEKNAGPCLCPI